jgi:surface carbohydrate biosynthesis protein
MLKPRVAVIVDHPQRDLAGLVLSAIELCQRGAVCHLVPLNLEDKEVWGLAPDLVLLNFFRPSNESFVRRLRSAGISYGLLDTEGALWESVEAYAANFWKDDTLMKGAVGVCLWGPRVADHLLAQKRFTSSQVTVTGCPRFDFYNPAWRSVLWDGAGGAEGSGRKRVLINTLYNIGNSQLVSREKNAAELERVHGWPRSKVEQYLEDESEAIRGFIELAGRLARAFPEVDVLLRPHPFESPDVYRRGLSGHPNVWIRCEGPVQPRIFGSVAVIQRSCTTAVEAALAGVPGLSPQWIPAPSLNPMAEDVSEACADYADLESRLREILSARYRQPDSLRSRTECVIRDWFFSSDGRAHERVGEAIAGCWNGSRRVDDGLCRRYLYGLGEEAAPLSTKLGQWTRYLTGISPNWSLRRLRKAPFLPKEVKQFGVPEVAMLARRVEEAWHATGRDLRPVSVRAAGERGDYVNSLMGQSVTVACDE